MTEFRARVMADGRIAFPGVVSYKLVDGPDEGTEVLCPPNVHTHPDPSSATPPPLDSMAAAKARADWDGKPRSSYSYVVLVQDMEAFEALRGQGLLVHKSHTGVNFHYIDKRIAPRG